jgi:replicative DNA helicase
MNAAVDQLRAMYGDRDEREVTTLRVPPQSVPSEQAVLGGLMLAPASLAKISDWITPEDFYRRDHQLIYQAILELAAKDRPYDAVTLGEWFESMGQAELVAGGAYLIELASTTPSAANITAYAEIVRDKAVLRRGIEVGTKLVNDCFQPDGRETTELLVEAQRAVAQLAGNPRAGGPQGMKEVGRSWYDEMQRRYADKGGLLGLPTPWARFNDLTAGFKPGELIVVAGRPSMGKSAFAVNVATCNALRNKRVLFFNLEMTAVSIYNRAIGSLMGVPLKWLRKPVDDARDDDGNEVNYWSRVTEGVRQMNGAALRIDDTPGLRLAQLLARTRREHMRSPLDLVIVDHLHLMPLPGKTRETVEIGEITRELKGLAKELGCPVMLLSQLNRSLETRQNKRPVMADLRESGNIEQDADVIVFLYRDDYYAEREERPSEYPGLVEIIVGKQREGEAGKVWARDRLAYGVLDDYDGPNPTSNKPKSQVTRRGVDA